MVEKKCIVCGNNFNTKGNVKCCSDECRRERKLQLKRQYYHNNKKQWIRYRENNKEKIKQKNKHYYENNKERISKQKKQYRENNKEKMKEQRKQHYQANKEKILKRNKQYRENNKEKIRQYNKQYRKNNKEKIKQINKQYRENNKERLLKQQKQYRKNNKEKIFKQKRQYYEQIYKDLSNKHNVSIDDLKTHIPPCFIKRELECWEQGSYFLDFIGPIYERANGRCEITGKKSNNLVVHHLNGYNWYVEGRMDWDNVVVIYEELHNAFHQKYGYGDNTAEQFWKFVEEYKKGLITLDDFKE